MSKRDVLEAILKQGVLPLFYHDDLDTCVSIVHTLYEAGIRVIEFTNRGSKALDNCRELLALANRDMPGLYIGIGTIKDETDARLFHDIGVHFFVSPVFTVELAAFANYNEQLWIPGCMTPSEICRAHSNGASLIKLFPANVLQPEFIKAVKEVFPEPLFMPTGGVTMETDNIQKWFQSGASTIGMGSRLITNDIIEKKDYNKLLQDTKSLLQIIKSVR